MSTSDSVKALLAICGRKQVELADDFGMSKQAMNKKFSLNRWSAGDLCKVADFCGCRLLFSLSNGQEIFIDPPPGKGKGPDETPGPQE